MLMERYDIDAKSSFAYSDHPTDGAHGRLETAFPRGTAFSQALPFLAMGCDFIPTACCSSDAWLRWESGRGEPGPQDAEAREG